MEFVIAAVIQGLDVKDEQDFDIMYRACLSRTVMGFRKKYDSHFIFTFAVVKVRYGDITMAKIVKH